MPIWHRATAPGDKKCENAKLRQQFSKTGSLKKWIVMETLTPRMSGMLLPCDPAELRAVRRFVRTMLPGYSDDLVYCVVLCANEITTNAILHSDTKAKGGGILLLVIELEDRIRVEVLDHGSAGEPTSEKYEDPDAENGRGLFVVDNHCDRTGTYTDDTGRNVWFEVNIY